MYSTICRRVEGTAAIRHVFETQVRCDTHLFANHSLPGESDTVDDQGAISSISTVVSDVLVSGHTTGTILVWRISEKEVVSLSCQCKVDAHRLSVNSLLLSEDAPANELRVFAAGDDESISSTKLRWGSSPSDPGNGLNLLSCQRQQHHWAAVTGLFAHGENLLSVGADQRVLFYGQCQNPGPLAVSHLSLGDPCGIVVVGCTAFVLGAGVEMLALNSTQSEWVCEP